MWPWIRLSRIKETKRCSTSFSGTLSSWTSSNFYEQQGRNFALGTSNFKKIFLEKNLIISCLYIPSNRYIRKSFVPKTNILIKIKTSGGLRASWINMKTGWQYIRSRKRETQLEKHRNRHNRQQTLKYYIQNSKRIKCCSSMAHNLKMNLPYYIETLSSYNQLVNTYNARKVGWICFQQNRQGSGGGGNWCSSFELKYIKHNRTNSQKSNRRGSNITIYILNLWCYCGGGFPMRLIERSISHRGEWK